MIFIDPQQDFLTPDGDLAVSGAVHMPDSPPLPVVVPFVVDRHPEAFVWPLHCVQS